MIRNMGDHGGFESARRALAGADPVLSVFIEAVGPCRLTPAPDPFVSLVEAIVSQQLAKMRSAGIVACRREGNNVFYRVADDRVVRMLGCLRNCNT